MVLKFGLAYERARADIPTIDSLPDDNINRIVWWYCGFVRNDRARSQPSVVVALREIVGHDELGDITYRRIPLVELGFVRVGSVWKGRVCRGNARFEQQIFDIDFDRGRFTSFAAAYHSNESPPFPQEQYPLQYEHDRNWMMEFRSQGGTKLILPCVELFRQLYGQSAEISRVLATYPWDHVEQRLILPLDGPDEPDRWSIALPSFATVRDSVFLAHLKYDRRTQSAAKRVYSALEVMYDPRSKTPCFIKIGPWFGGPGQIMVSGFWTPERDRFVALTIDGCSEPGGVPIIYHRARPDSSDAQELPEPPNGPRTRVISQNPADLSLRGDREPGHGTPLTKLQDQAFQILGKTRALVARETQWTTNTRSPVESGRERPTTTFSTGDRQGAAAEVGKAMVQSRHYTLLESRGTLRDMWNAMLALKEARPDKIESVEWYTPQTGFSHDPEPCLNMLESFGAGQDVTPDQRRWISIDSETGRRGILFARMVMVDEPIYIVEIQRRTYKLTSVPGRPVYREEKLRGLVFKLDEQADFAKWSETVLSAIRFSSGKFNELAPHCPGQARTFKHAPGHNEDVLCQRALLNALSKVGVVLS